MTLQERAESVRQKLFDRYNKLNDLWIQAEEHLSKYHIPHDVSFDYVTFADRLNQPDTTARAIGFVKCNGKWRIAHCEYDLANIPEDWTPILECSATIRVQCVKCLEQLEEEIVKSSEGFVSLVDSAMKVLSSTLKKMK